MDDYKIKMYERRYHLQDISNASFLITGGAGFIGSNIVEYLLKHGAGKVRVLDNFSTGSRENLQDFEGNPSFEMFEGDIRNLQDCRNAMEGIDYVSHQAALGSVPRSINDPISTNDVNVGGFLNVVVAARDAAVRRLVYAASSSTYGDHPALPKREEVIGNPLSPYAVTKLVNELYADVFSKVYQFHSLGLRYFNVFGPRQNPKGPYAAVVPLFVEAALENKAPNIYGDGETSRDFTFVSNAVQANILGLLSDIKQHAVVNIAYGTRTSLNELWNGIQTLTKVTASPAYHQQRPGDVRHSLADISKANALIGYKPDVSVQQGLEKTVAWYKQHFTI